MWHSISKRIQAQRPAIVAQVVEWLPRKNKALSSNPATTKRKGKPCGLYHWKCGLFGFLLFLFLALLGFELGAYTCQASALLLESLHQPIKCIFFKCFFGQAVVAHACNLSYSGGSDQEDHGLKPAQANSSQDPISKKPTTKKEKSWWSGSRCRPCVQTPVPKKKQLLGLECRASYLVDRCSAHSAWPYCSHF
jgi:hypothetical protein